MKALIKYLTGRGKLWEAFWLLTLMPFVTMVIIAAFTYYLLYKLTFSDFSINQLPPVIEHLCLTILPTIFILIIATIVTLGLTSIWQCARHCTHKIWTILARVFVFAIIMLQLNILYDSEYELIPLIYIAHVAFIVALFALIIKKYRPRTKTFIAILIAISNIIFYGTKIYIHDFNPDESISYYKNTNDAEKANNLYNIAQTYYFGMNGHNKNANMAALWYQIAADNGSILAKNALAVMYTRGDGVKQDRSKAIKLYEEAGKAGDYAATYNLGLAYEKGNGVPQDYKKAAAYYLLASNHGVGCAQNDLGALYASGKGVKQNDGTAMHWLKTAGTTMLDASDHNEFYNPDIKTTPETLTETINAFAQYRFNMTKQLNNPNQGVNPAIVENVTKMADFYESRCRN